MCLVAFLTLAGTSAFAQVTSGPESTRPRIKIGPLSVIPTVVLTNAGVDNNVFNEPDQASPKSDFTMTVTPAADLWLKAGRTWLTGTVREDLVYYHTYANERSVNGFYKAAWLVPLNRVTVNAGADYLSTRDRPGYEIAARSQRTEVGFEGAVMVRASAKTSFGVRGTRRRTMYDSFATFYGISLQEALNRTVTTASLTARYRLTLLTSLGLEVSRGQDRFEFSPLRDSDSTAIAGSVEFKPLALIKGSASFGYQNFKPRSFDIPGYQGGTAALNLSYVAFRVTRLNVQATRDIQYSYEISQPYYLLTGGTFSILQPVFGPIDVTARAGAQRLAYRDRVLAVVTASNRIDHINSYGGGVGYRLGRGLRLGFNIDHYNRTSPVNFLQYNGLTYGMSVTYAP